jgi:hypothetical protein
MLKQKNPAILFDHLHECSNPSFSVASRIAHKHMTLAAPLRKCVSVVLVAARYPDAHMTTQSNWEKTFVASGGLHRKNLEMMQTFSSLKV